MAIAGALAVELWYRGDFVSIVLGVLGLLAFFTGSWKLRVGGSANGAAAGIVGAYVMVISALGWAAGGLGAPALYTLAVAPALATLIAGTRSGLIWTGVTLVVFVIFIVLAITGNSPPTRLDAAALVRGHAIAGIAVIVAMAAMTILHERVKRTALEEADLAREAAETAAQAKSQFLATMSHEIRTPMHGVLGASAILRNKDLSPDAIELIDIVHSSAEALLVIINDILDFSQLEAGKMTLVSENFNLSEVIGAVMNMLRSGAESKGLRLNCTIAPDAVEQVRGDAARIRQLLFNLVGNAIKFTERGSVEVWADSRLDDDALRVRLEISDTGPGIAQADQERIFGHFEQVASSRSRLHGGSGLGLAICKRLCEAMGGRIGVDSTVGKGSTFWVELPLKIAHAVLGEAPDPTVLPIAMTGSSILGRRVLLAEDNATSRMVSQAMLHQLGCTVDSASNGAEAVQLVQQGAYDVVLMDCFMPMMDGFAATSRIRALDDKMSEIPIIGFTASTTPEDLALCQRAGMDDVLAKPATMESLQMMLDRWSPTIDTYKPR